jgi:hypothetical protein
MRGKLLCLAGAVFAVVGQLGAGSLELQPKEAPPPTITQSEPWQFTIAAPSLMPGFDGTIGVRGVNANLDIGFDQILQHLNMVFAMQAEARKGPFGIFGEIFYAGLSDNGQVNGLVNNVHEQVEQYLIDTGFLHARWGNQRMPETVVRGGFVPPNRLAHLLLHGVKNVETAFPFPLPLGASLLAWGRVRT